MNTYPVNPSPSFAVPLPTARGGGLAGGLMHLIGRSLGANKVQGGFDANGNYTPQVAVNPVRDAIFNGGQAYDSAQAMNTGIGSELQSQNLGLQTLHETDKGQMAKDTNVAVQQKLADIARAQEAQRLAENTRAGIVGTRQDGSITPAAESQVDTLNPIQMQDAELNAAKRVMYHHSPAGNLSLEQGYNADDTAQAWANTKGSGITAPVGGAAAGFTPFGPISVKGGTPFSSSSNTGTYVSPDGMVHPSQENSQSGTTAGQVSIPTNPQIMAKLPQSGGAPTLLQGGSGVDPSAGLIDPYGIMGQSTSGAAQLAPPSEQPPAKPVVEPSPAPVSVPQLPTGIRSVIRNTAEGIGSDVDLLNNPIQHAIFSLLNKKNLGRIGNAITGVQQY